MKKVLIVDDEKELAEVLGDQFEYMGFEASIFNSSKEALKYMTTNDAVLAYDLIVSDIKMPEMTGDQLFAEVKNTFKERLPPVIFISGFSELSVDRAVQLGAIGIIDKPFTFKTLKSRVDEILLNKPLVSS